MTSINIVNAQIKIEHEQGEFNIGDIVAIADDGLHVYRIESIWSRYVEIVPLTDGDTRQKMELSRLNKYFVKISAY